MKVLVTGGAGFIGTNLVNKLIRDGHEVVVLDDMFLGRPDNLSDLPKRKLKLIRASVTDYATVLNASKGCDAIFHLAARSSAPICEDDPRDATNVNVGGFVNVLQAAKFHGIKKVIYASTSSLYNGMAPPHREDMQVTPKTVYEATMYAREIYARMYYESYGIEAVGMRFFSVYGPYEKHKQQYANVITQFLWAVMNGEQPVIYGDGTQTRDFIFVDDVVDAMIKAMYADDVGGEVFNVGTGTSHTFNDVIELISKVTGLDVKPKYIPNPIRRYVYHTRADIRKAKKYLGFRARTTLHNGIKMLYSFYSSTNNGGEQ